MTMYGHEHYSPDPLPLHQRQTLGEIAAVTPRPTTEPLTHSGSRSPFEDNLLTGPQRAIEKCTEDILTVLSSPCRCDKCRNGVKVLLSDLLSEVMTETTIVTLSIGKLEREVKHLNVKIERLLERERKC